MSPKTVIKHKEYGSGELIFWDYNFSKTTKNNTNEQ